MALFAWKFVVHLQARPLVDEQDPRNAMAKGRLPSAGKEQTGKPGAAPQISS
jgi:hypothetical protein